MDLVLTDVLGVLVVLWPLPMSMAMMVVAVPWTHG